MHYYFYYERPQRKSAMVVALNIVVLLLMHQALHHYLPQGGQQSSVEQILSISNYAVVIITIVLIALFIYLYVKNKSIIVSVTAKHMRIVDPTFGDFDITLNTSDIKEFKQVYSAGNGHSHTYIVLNNGEIISLVFNNYHLDRQQYFDALTKANPKILVPSSPHRYTSERPLWAQSFLDKVSKLFKNGSK
ncbi:MAG: hypothetical protein WA981_04350 [Glaciecola sp.]